MKTKTHRHARSRQVRLGLLLLRASGFSRKEAASLLGLSLPNTDYHWSLITNAAGVRNLWQLAELVRTKPGLLANLEPF